MSARLSLPKFSGRRSRKNKNVVDKYCPPPAVCPKSSCGVYLAASSGRVTDRRPSTPPVWLYLPAADQVTRECSQTLLRYNFNECSKGHQTSADEEKDRLNSMSSINAPGLFRLQQVLQQTSCRLPKKSPNSPRFPGEPPVGRNGSTGSSQERVFAKRF